MKRILTLCLVLVSLALLTSFARATITVENETWLDVNSLQVGTGNYSALYNDQALMPGGHFFLGREYLTFKGDLGTDFYGDPIYERVTFDFANATSTGANGIVKYAYFDYPLLKMETPIVDGDQTNTVKLNALVFSAGLQPVYFGNISFWQYVLPIKDATELYAKPSYVGVNGATGAISLTNYSGIDPTPSADLGLGLSGKLITLPGITSSLISYYFQFLDGDGYKVIQNNSGLPANSPFGSTNGGNFAYQATVFISPLDGILIGGTYRNLQYDDGNSITTIIPNSTETSYDLMVSARNVMGIPIDFLFQYIDEACTNNWAAYTENTNATGGSKAGLASSEGYDFNGVVYTVSIGYGLMNWTIEPMIRYDYYNPDTGIYNGQNGANVSNSILYLGGSLKLDPNLVVKPMVGFYLTENGQPSSDWLVWFEFAYKLNFTIFQ
jgi:hypothetical protein